MNEHGLFITFEGGEGAGKSSLITGIFEWLKKSYQVIATREPGGTELSEKIRECILQNSTKIAARSELFLFLASRVQHVEEKILPALQSGAIVLCDRFSDSTIAYQGYARELGIDYVENLCIQATGDVTPDYTFFLNINPSDALQRRLVRNTQDKSFVDSIERESMAFHEKVYEGFTILCKRHPKRIISVDVKRSLEEVFIDVQGIISKKLLEKGYLRHLP